MRAISLRRAAGVGAASACALVLLAACGDSPSEGADPGDQGSSADASDTSLGRGSWLVVISTAGGADAETSTSTYISYDPSTGTTSKRALPGVKAGSAGPDDAALLVSTDRKWAIPDTGVPSADRRSGKLTVYSLADESTRKLDIRALTGDRRTRPLGWAFDPQQPDTLRVVDTANRIWALGITAGSATRQGTLARGPWIFTDGFNHNTGEPWVESIESDATRPKGNGVAETGAVERAGGTVLYSESDELAELPKSPCRLGGGFASGDGTTWMFCADRPELTTHYLPADGKEWQQYGKPSAPVAPEAASVPLVLPPG